jgi:type I restriction enzyme S subunit
MSSWRNTTVDDLGQIITGYTPPIKKTEYFGNEYPFITPTDITMGSRIVQTERFLSQKGYEYRKNRLLPPDAVCVTCIGSLGKICMTTVPSATNQQINSIVVNPSKYDPYFVYYLLRTKTAVLQSIAGGVATPIVKKSTFAGINVCVPPLPTQQKIAAVLRPYDKLIENNTRRIEILEEMAQIIYRQWFVEFQFPGHEQVKMVESELGLIPQGWEVKRLGEMCHVIMGQSPKSEFYNETGEGLPFHQGVRDFGKRFPTDRVYCTVQNRIAEAGDILFSVRAPVGRINIAHKKIVIGRGLSAIRSKRGNQAFLFQQLKERFQEEDTMGGGTIFSGIRKDDLLGIPLLSPGESVIDQFEEIVNPIFSQLVNLAMKNINLRQTRDLLLPKLISGELDVSKLDPKGWSRERAHINTDRI